MSAAKVSHEAMKARREDRDPVRSSVVPFMNDESAHKIPRIRFTNWNDGWSKLAFTDIATIRRGLTYSPIDCSSSGIRVLRSSNIDEDMFRLFQDDVFVNSDAVNIPSVKDKDILITAANGSSHLVGKHALVRTDGNGEMVHGGFMLLATSKEAEFLNASMCAPWYREFIESNMMGGNGALGNLPKKAFDELQLMAPVSSEERGCVGTFFETFNMLISVRQSALEKLEALKKSMLVNMFPQGDAKVPKIRFKGFEGEWEDVRLGDKGRTYNGLSGKTSADFGHGAGKYVTYMNVFENAISKAEQCESVEIDTRQNEVRSGDVFFTTSSETPEEVGMSSVWLSSGKNTYLNSFCFGYRPHGYIDSKFLAYLLRSMSFRGKVVKLAQGISRFNISKGKVMDIHILMPEREEQVKIGEYFCSLGQLIAARRDEIEQLKRMKAALLDRMFV